MSRRRRRIRNRRRKKPQSKWLIAVQLLVLAGVLAFLIGFRDYLAMSASTVMNSVAGSDLEVEKKKGKASEAQPALETPEETDSQKGNEAKKGE